MLRRATVLIALTAACTLTACTSSGGNKDQSGSPTPSSSAPTSPSSSTTKTSASPLPTFTPPKTVHNVPADRKDVSLTSCKSATGGWEASGTAVNRHSSTVTFEITVYFTTASATDLAFAKTRVAVKSGKTATWTAKAKFAAPASVLCVPRGIARVKT